MAKKNQSKDFIYLYSKKVKISKLVQDFTVIPAHEIVKYLLNKEIYLPNYLHKALIRKNIAPAIAEGETNDRFSDEMKHRLKWFDQFTIYQLERLASGYQLPINVTEYKKDFWDIIIRNRTELGINNLEFVKLQNLTLKYAREEQETYEQMNEEFSKLYFEPEGYFDGSLLEDAKEVLEKATTLTEIRELGKRYGVEIPRRINKKQLIDIVAIKLNLDEDKIQEISKKSILEIERYAKRRQVNVSIELKKSDMLDYVLIKMPSKVAPKYTNSLKVFAGMNIEEYLYSIKFQEIASKVSEKRNLAIKRGVLILAAASIVGIVGYLVYTNFLV